MSQVHTSHHHTRVIDSGKIASHLETTVEQLEQEASVLEIDVVDASHTERSVFYRDDGERVYHVNPKEHPAITGAIDALLTRIATEHGIEVKRRAATDAYIVSVTTTCSKCRVGGTDMGTSSDSVDDLYLPRTVVEKLSSCPVAAVNKSCAEATAEGTAAVYRDDGTYLTGEGDMRVAAFKTQPVPTGDTVTVNHAGHSEPVTGTGLVLAENGLDSLLAKLVGVLDVIAYVRTHPAINSGHLDQYPETIQEEASEVPDEKIDEFQDHCNEFLLETAPGWRLRWILEVVDDDPKPLENIAAAANVALPEARIITRLLEEWGIVTSETEQEERRYQLAAAYTDWRDSISQSGVEKTEPAYLSETADPEQLIKQSYQALTASSY